MPVSLSTPLSESTVRALSLNEQVLLSGVIFTARDAVHKHLAGDCDLRGLEYLRGGIFYQCGPVIVCAADGSWQVTAAGPTTSSREEPYMATLIEKLSLRAIIGKGGMGAKTLAACQRFGCVYLHAVGGAAQVLAAAVKAVPRVEFLAEFGFPEALWTLTVEDFPAVVSMDANGHSLHEQVRTASQAQLAKIAAPVES